MHHSVGFHDEYGELQQDMIGGTVLQSIRFDKFAKN